MQGGHAHDDDGHLLGGGAHEKGQGVVARRRRARVDRLKLYQRTATAGDGGDARPVALGVRGKGCYAGRRADGSDRELVRPPPAESHRYAAAVDDGTGELRELLGLGPCFGTEGESGVQRAVESQIRSGGAGELCRRRPLGREDVGTAGEPVAVAYCQ